MQIGSLIFGTNRKHAKKLTEKKLVEGPTMRTFSGKIVNLFDFKVTDVDINDIAVSMANTCRFRGHVRESINDAMHSLMVRQLVIDTLRDVGASELDRWCWELILAALMHDASEAYSFDPSPGFKEYLCVKTPDGMMGYREFEKQKIQRVIYDAIGCSDCLDHPYIISADKLACSWECANCADRPRPTGYPREPMIEWRNITDPLLSAELFSEVYHLDREAIASCHLMNDGRRVQPILPSFAHLNMPRW